ncbi:MAG: hypothetical protein O9302_06460 [Cyclobacteriaceae bacterium]|jgi:hypothetical protein|nr:hypothetical protein [Cytophagales bacterium]MCZ8327681.1 hypothetical protein [Cyclobacteriaceae bacterium]
MQKHQVTIKYNNDIFGVVDVYLNDIHLISLHKNQTHTFETYAGLNTIKVKVSGTDYKPFIRQINLRSNQSFTINGYFSKARLINYLASWLVFDFILIVLFLSSELLKNFFWLFVLFLSLPFAVQIGNALYYFILKKGYSVFLVSDEND